MPTRSLTYPFISHKSLKLLFLLLLSPLFFYGQSLTGLWTGTISNDSNTIRKDQSFEIALTEYRGKVYGYSRSEFIVDDVLFYVVKRVKGTIEGDVCEVIDDEIIAFNFPTKLDKGVKVSSTFRRNKNDGVWHLEGTWKTNVTKKYYSVTGKIGLEEEKDLTASKIFPHLEELKIADELVFYKERKEGLPVVKIVKPEKAKSSFIADAKVTENTEVMAAISKPAIQTKEAGLAIVTNETQVDPAKVPATESIYESLSTIKKTADELPKTKTNAIPAEPVVHKPAISDKDPVLNINPDVVTDKKSIASATENKETTPVTVEKAIVKNSGPGINKTETKNPVNSKASVETTTIIKNNTVVAKKDPTTVSTEKTIVKKETTLLIPTEIKSTTTAEVTQNTLSDKQQVSKTEPVSPSFVGSKKMDFEIKANAATISGRKSEFTQEVNYRSDSLVLSLYDNGEIDGDTVSVFMNGEVIMAKQGLKASAIKKTIYISPDGEDFTLVLFAENLGKYPPNTGLLVVRDGEDVYNLRFSSDFQKNAGIVFRRKKN